MMRKKRFNAAKLHLETVTFQAEKLRLPQHKTYYGKLFSIILLLAFFLSSGSALAVNGVNLMGIGTISRSMGGVGIAAPQDAVSSINCNPAAMAFAGYGNKSQLDFDATFLTPDSRQSKVSNDSGWSEAASNNGQTFLVPALGLATPVDKENKFRFGLGLFAVTGLGMDYRETAIDQSASPYYGGLAPLISGTFAYLAGLKVAPALSYKITDQLAVGLALHANNITLDLGAGESSGYAYGAQIGIAYKFNDSIQAGATYKTHQSAKIERLADLNGDGHLDNIDLGLPAEAGIGVSYSALQNKLLVEADVKWINWADADGWKQFDWDNQWVYAIGAQYKVIPRLALRVGYNYAKNQIKEHNGFIGAYGQTTDVQGKAVPTYYYETLRSIGIPAMLEHHICIGLGFDITPNITANVAYIHEFGGQYRETGIGLFGGNTTIEQKMKVQSIDIGFSWKF